MRVAVAFNDVVINVIDAPDLMIAADVYPGAEVFDADETEVGMGWLREGEGWVVPPAPEPIPRPLTHLEFIEHVQAAGDIDDVELVAAKTDPNLAAFWIRFELARELERDHPTTVQGLTALVATGHLTEGGREAIVELWPTA